MGDSTVGGRTSNEVPPAIKEQDRLLPIANVGRIMKQMLPTNAKISKDAKETMQECVSEFIGFVTSEASEKCRKERRKTVSGDDICWALRTLGFDDYAGPMKRYLNRYREVEGDKSGQLERAQNNSGEDNMDDPSGSYPNPFGQQPGSHEDEGSSSLRFNMIGRTHSSSSRPY